MVEGSVYGPLKPGELEELKVSREPVKDVRITIKLKTGCCRTDDKFKYL
jgi:hypothetical protein